jgi:hypothetical protein
MQSAPIRVIAQPPALPSAPASLDMIDPRAVQLSWQDRRWLLVHQGHTLKDFGSRVEEARLALRLIHELGLNQRGVIGSPVPHLEYWLVDGHAPGSLPRSGMHTFPIEPDRLRVEQVQNQWCVRDGNRVLFTFGQHADEAREALAVLQKYHFTQVGFVGQGMPSMIVFGGNGQGDAPTMAATHGASAAGRQFAPQKFPRLVTNSDGSPRVEPMKGGSAAHAQGYEGVVQPLVPPLFAPAKVRATPPGETPTLGNLRAAAWHTQPNFGPQAPAQPAIPAGQEERRAFDWRQVQVRQENGAWKLTSGSQLLAGFGADLQQAQKALAAIRYYRFTELRAVAGGDGAAYFLAHAAAPRGLMLGLQGVELQPDKLDVQLHAEGYAVCQGSRVVLQFRDRPEPARQALETIQRQKLDRLCHIGEPGKGGMTILVRSRSEFSGSLQRVP